MKIDYLKESYGGAKINPLNDGCFYCYTIHDIIENKYYSGVRVGVNGFEHDLFNIYFTSSTVIDFKYRLIHEPYNFEYIVEYFFSKEEAFNAERDFHIKYNVGKSIEFYNAINSGGSNCGAGTVLCKNVEGDTYRVSAKEYTTGNHSSVTSGTMMVTVISTGMREHILCEDYDKKIHKSDLSGMTKIYDTKLKINRRITIKEFNDDVSRYHGSTKGVVSAYDVYNKTFVSIPKDIFDDCDRYVGITHKKSPSYNKKLGKFNKGFIVCYSIKNDKNVRIKVIEYNKNKNEYLNLCCKKLYLVKDCIHTTFSKLKKYQKETCKIILKEDFHNYKNKILERKI